jgi:competence protein ComEC
VRVGLGGLAGCYAAIVVGALATPWLLRRRRIAALRRRNSADGPKSQARLRFSARRRVGRAAAAAVALAVLALGWTTAGVGAGGAAPPASGLRVSVLDVGQGDAILLQPAGAAPVLVDGGPPDDGLASLLDEAGVGSLGAAIVTHDQSDHAGGIADLLGAMPVRRLLYAVLDRGMLGEARGAGARTARIAAGTELRSGRLRLDVLWPPRPLLDQPRPGEDPNRLALVMVARWRGFSMLLSADAEAESTPIDPGPVDVLKVAHHGSEDAGLDALLDRTRPSLSVISVGEGNPYGHPTPATLATLAAHGVPVLRTDRDGTIVLEVSPDSVEVRTGA